jgi:hypothetical protein
MKVKTIIALLAMHASANGGWWLVDCWTTNSTSGTPTVAYKSEIWDVLDVANTTTFIAMKTLISDKVLTDWSKQTAVPLAGRFTIKSLNSSYVGVSREAEDSVVGTVGVRGEGEQVYPLHSTNYTMKVVNDGWNCFPLFYLVWGEGRM